MSRWIDNRLADRLFMVNRVSETKNIDPESVEKDWWVIMVLTGCVRDEYGEVCLLQRRYEPEQRLEPD